MLAERIDLELHFAAVGTPDLLVREIDGQRRVRAAFGVVVVRDEGRQRLYRLSGIALKPIFDWVKDFELLWSERFARLDVVLEELQQAETEEAEER